MSNMLLYITNGKFDPVEHNFDVPVISDNFKSKKSKKATNAITNQTQENAQVNKSPIISCYICKNGLKTKFNKKGNGFKICSHKHQIESFESFGYTL
jgi:hypothetical protein